MSAVSFAVRGEYIALDALLKATGVCGSGGEAKTLITGGGVSVDGEVETRRARKIRPGQVVTAQGVRITIHAADA